MSAGDQLFALQRRERIMDEIREHGSVSVGDIAARLSVSELTIRRDINSLAQQGLVTRVHGGATLRSSIEPGLAPGLAGHDPSIFVTQSDPYAPRPSTTFDAGTGDDADAR